MQGYGQEWTIMDRNGPERTKWTTRLSIQSIILMGVQRALGPLVGVFRGQSPLNGRGGIRTPGTIASTSVFETDAFGHSATLPE